MERIKSPLLRILTGLLVSVTLASTEKSVDSYSPSWQICCSGSVHTLEFGPRTRCCGNTTYDVTRSVCCDGKHAVPLIEPLYDSHKQKQMQCCGQDAYDPTGNEVCCDGLVIQKPYRNNGCCGRRIYDVEQAVCCSVMMGNRMLSHLHHRWSPLTSCCGLMAYEPDRELCCGGKVYKKYSTTTQCCGDKRVYDSGMQGCCGGQVYEDPFAMMSCCANVTYDVTSELCCAGTVHPDPYRQLSCCGERAFNARNQTCCGEETVLDSPSIKPSDDPMVAAASGDDYATNDDDIELMMMMTMGIPLTKSSPSIPLQCCDNVTYDSSFALCCAGNVIPIPNAEKLEEAERSLYSCCGDKQYHMNKEMCCGGRLHPVSMESRCCGQQVYSANSHTCCGTTVISLQEDAQTDVSRCCKGHVVRVRADLDVCC